MQVDCILIFKEIQKKNNKMASLIVLFVAAGLAAYMYVHNHSVLDRIAEEGWVYYFY
jgi:high-affinity Fe2+/Pb2+ permease